MQCMQSLADIVTAGTVTSQNLRRRTVCTLCTSYLLYRVLPVMLTAAAAAATGVAVFVISFPLHASVLEPDLHLALAELHETRYLDPSMSRQVATEVKLLLQFQSLRPAVGRPQPGRPADALLCTRQPKRRLLRLLMMLMMG